MQEVYREKGRYYPWHFYARLRFTSPIRRDLKLRLAVRDGRQKGHIFALTLAQRLRQRRKAN